jgi:TRAP transporter TAXI family solute receptor
MLLKMFKKNAYVILVVILIGAFVMAPSQAGAKAVKLKFAAMTVGGNWYLYASTMAAAMKPHLPAGSSIDVLPESGGIGNPMMVDKGAAQMAISFGPCQNWAWNGTQAYADKKKKFQNIRALIGGINSPNVHKMAVIAQRKLNIDSLQDVVDKKMKLRVLSDRLAALGGVSAALICSEYGFSLDDIEKWGGSFTRMRRSQMIPLMQDGRADLAIYFIGSRQPDVVELAMRSDIKFLPLSVEVQKRMMAKYGYSPVDIFKDEFKGVTEPVRDVGLPTGVIVRKDLPNDIVYAMMKAISENVEKIRNAHASLRGFDPKTGWQPSLNGNVPLHPGAERFYKEAGWMK